jgi:hypothetical protein
MPGLLDADDECEPPRERQTFYTKYPLRFPHSYALSKYRHNLKLSYQTLSQVGLQITRPILQKTRSESFLRLVVWSELNPLAVIMHSGYTEICKMVWSELNPLAVIMHSGYTEICKMVWSELNPLAVIMHSGYTEICKMVWSELNPLAVIMHSGYTEICKMVWS